MSPKECYEGIGKKMATTDQVILGQMFGKASLKFQNKAFAAFQNDCMIFRLGAVHIEEIRANFPTAENWDPSGKGRPMKDWFSVSHNEVEQWESLALHSLLFLKSNI